MNIQVLNIIDKLIKEKAEFIKNNKELHIDEITERDVVIELALTNRDYNANDIYNELLIKRKNKPIINPIDILKSCKIVRSSEREKINDQIDWLYKGVFVITTTEENKPLANSYLAEISPFLDNRRNYSLPLISRIVLIRLANELSRSQDKYSIVIGKSILKLIPNLRDATALFLVRDIVKHIAKKQGLLPESTLKDENQDLKNSLFALTQENSELYEKYEQLLECSKERASIEFFTKMNSKESGMILDNLTLSHQVVWDLLNSGWIPEKVELKGIIYSLKLLLEFFSTYGLKPIETIGNNYEITLNDIDKFEYIGSEFKDVTEIKTVIVQSSGWSYNDQVISKPKVIESYQNTNF